MREELDDLKREREREDARNRSAVAEAEEHRKQNVRQRRLEGGSRFNIRYRDQLPSTALTPEAVIAALAQYVDFSQLSASVAPQTGIPGQVGPQTGQPPRGGLPRKGMLAQEVDAQLGPPTSSKERKEGTLRVQTKDYSTADGRVTGEFVEGVLIRYTITSK